jgi:hypothetical protein
VQVALALDLFDCGYRCSPLVWADVVGVLREEPVVAIEIFDSVLALAVDGFVEVFDDFCACRFCSLEVRCYIFDEDGEALRSIAVVGWSVGVWAYAMEHDPCISEMHLCAADGVSVAVVLGEAEYLCEPVDRLFDVVIHDVRKHCVRGYGAVIQHALLGCCRCRGGGSQWT